MLGGQPLAREAEKTNVPGNADAVCCRLPCLPQHHHCRALRLRDLSAEAPDRSARLSATASVSPAGWISERYYEADRGRL